MAEAEQTSTTKETKAPIRFASCLAQGVGCDLIVSITLFRVRRAAATKSPSLLKETLHDTGLLGTHEVSVRPMSWDLAFPRTQTEDYKHYCSKLCKP